MRKIVQFVIAVGLALAPVLFAAPAGAGITHTWVASTGNDSNSCDRPAPCATLSGAYNKTNDGGEITCADSGIFGGLVITGSITVNCENAIGSTLGNGPPIGIGNFNIPTGNSGVVVLRGFDLDGATACGNITYFGSGALHIEKVKINQSGGPCNGVSFIPNGSAKLFISDSDITNNGIGGTGAGVFLAPAAGVVADFVIERTHIENNNYGINYGVIVAGTTAGIIHGVIHDSVVSGNVQDGILVGTASSSIEVDNTVVSGNGAGVFIKPDAGGSVTATFNAVTIAGNLGGGLKSDTTNGVVNVDISNSTVTNNAGNGLNAVGGTGGANMLNLSHDVIAKNGAAGIQANGTNAAALIDTTLLDSNSAGAISAIGGGRVLTYGNNRIVGGPGTGFTGSASLQ